MIEYHLHRLPAWAWMAGITFGRHVWVKNLDDRVTIEHELVHVRQQAEHPVWFWVSYLLLLPLGWNPWRRDWEAEAYATQARIGCPIDGDHGLAAQIAAAGYLWPCRRAAAAAAIRKYLT